MAVNIDTSVPDIPSLLAQLNASKVASTNNPLYQTIKGLLNSSQAIHGVASNIVAYLNKNPITSSGGGGGGTPGPAGPAGIIFPNDNNDDYFPQIPGPIGPQGATGATGAPGSGGSLIDHQGMTNVVATTTETIIYTYSVTGGTLGTTNHLHLRMVGDQQNTSGTSNVITIRVYYGSSVLYQSTGTWASNAVLTPWFLDMVLGNYGATNANFVVIESMYGDRTAQTHGVGNWDANGLGQNVLYGLGTVDSTSTQTFKVSVQHSVNNATTSWRMFGAYLELV
jgi:hypothetical protein